MGNAASRSNGKSTHWQAQRLPLGVPTDDKNCNTKFCAHGRTAKLRLMSSTLKRLQDLHGIAAEGLADIITASVDQKPNVDTLARHLRRWEGNTAPSPENAVLLQNALGLPRTIFMFKAQPRDLLDAYTQLNTLVGELGTEVRAGHYLVNLPRMLLDLLEMAVAMHGYWHDHASAGSHSGASKKPPRRRRVYEGESWTPIWVEKIGATYLEWAARSWAVLEWQSSIVRSSSPVLDRSAADLANELCRTDSTSGAEPNPVELCWLVLHLGLGLQCKANQILSPSAGLRSHAWDLIRADNGRLARCDRIMRQLGIEGIEKLVRSVISLYHPESVIKPAPLRTRGLRPRGPVPRQSPTRPHIMGFSLAGAT